MIKNLIFGIYLIILDFLVKSLKAETRTNKKKITHFTEPFRSKKTHSFYEPQLTQLTKHVSGWCQKKHLPYTISRRAINEFSEDFGTCKIF